MRKIHVLLSAVWLTLIGLLLLHDSYARADVTAKFQEFDKAIAERVVWEDKKLADAISDIGLVSMYAYPIILSLDGSNDDKGSHLVTLGTAHLLNAGVTKVVKVWANRERPNGEDRRSFYSGHTSAVFTSAGYICRYESSHCTEAMVGAAAVGYLRMAANKHWATDVIVGAIMGGVTGHSVPIYVKGF